MSNKEDLKLVELAKQGDKQAFTTLVEKYQRLVYSIVIKIVGSHQSTDDVMQETFIKVYNKLDSFKGISSFKSWLYRIAINTAKNSIRGKKIETVPEQFTNLKVEERAGESIEKREVKQRLLKEIETLPKKQKLALTLRIFDELPFKEIAEIMSCPYDTAKANFRHAVMNLRKKVDMSEFLGGEK